MAILIYNVLRGLQLIIFADAILSWLMTPEQFPRSFTTRITDPLYAPIRAVIGPDKTGGIDISPIAMLLLLNFMQNMLTRGL